MDRQVETDRIRLERGNISLSDVAQSESSLAGAQAKLIQAENDFLTSKLNYENVIGKLSDPELLDKSSITEATLPKELNILSLQSLPPHTTLFPSFMMAIP